jgi:hypothetical protein
LCVFLEIAAADDLNFVIERMKNSCVRTGVILKALTLKTGTPSCAGTVQAQHERTGSAGYGKRSAKHRAVDNFSAASRNRYHTSKGT